MSKTLTEDDLQRKGTIENLSNTKCMEDKNESTVKAKTKLSNNTGCTGERCIEADDFGHSIITVSARYPKPDFAEQVGATQVAPWRESGYRVNGRPLTMMVKGWDYGVDKNNGSELSAWCAWFSASGEGDKLSNFCERLQDCQFIDGRMCTRSADARIGNAPCIFRHGVGLYALIGAKGTNPNQSLSSMRDPTGISMHLGEPTSGYTLYDIDKNGKSRQAGGRVYTFDSNSEKHQYNDSQLYFKILDKFYDDNSGQYKIVIKSGINRSNPDPISYVTMLVKQFLFGIQGNGKQLLPKLKKLQTIIKFSIVMLVWQLLKQINSCEAYSNV